MKGIVRVAAALVCGLVMRASGDSPLVLVRWDFDKEADTEWARHANCSKDVRIEDGVLKGAMTGWDPFVTSPAFSVDATAGQAVEMRVKTTAGGSGNIFWVPAGANGPQQKWSATTEWIGDNEWHEYRVQPYWQGEKKISRFRIDFAVPTNNAGTFEVDWVRVVDTSAAATAERAWCGTALGAWSATDGATADVRDDALAYASSGSIGTLTSPNLKIPTDETCVVAVEMAAREGDSGCVTWASDAVSGLQRKTFRIKPDGRFHTYNIDLGTHKNWIGNIVLLKLTPVLLKDARATVRSIRVSDEPLGGADVSVTQARLADAINRAGKPAQLLIQFSNAGGMDAKDVALAVKKLPRGVSVVTVSGWNKVPEIPASGSVTHTVLLDAKRAVSGDVVFAVTGAGTDGATVKARIEILPDLKLAKATYVPVPKPLKSDYEIGALYFPGWSKTEAWARIWPVAPERKPVLGWYDEANPEVVDWQIKWAVENGLKYFLVDWYWHKGSQHHDHWIKAFQQARYRSYLKWAMMWANHNAAGSHSEEDQRKVTKFWIENYFSMPEYYRIDDKPVVMIWSPQNMNRDLGGGEGCRRLLEMSRAMAVEAGYKGIYFIAMKWPEASWEPKVVQGYKDMGFDMTSIYHYMDHGGKAANPRRFPFELVADSNYAHWKGLHETGILPFLPNLSTGWDDRPWHGDKGIEIYGRTVKDFRRICRDAKKFADETGVKRLTLAPLNEWGEGSYAEPCAQFGFGMYEAVRDTFCQKPEEGWPLNYGPQDVGCGPYDLPPPVKDDSTEWFFAKGALGWYGMMGIEGFKTGDAGLDFKTASADPAIERGLDAVRAKQVAKIAVRMKVSDAKAGDACQLFWQVGASPASEATMLRLPVTPDGQFRDYVFEVGQHKQWRGRINKLRFDPVNQKGAAVTVESVRMIPSAK